MIYLISNNKMVEYRTAISSVIVFFNLLVGSKCNVFEEMSHKVESGSYLFNRIAIFIEFENFRKS